MPLTEGQPTGGESSDSADAGATVHGETAKALSTPKKSEGAEVTGGWGLMRRARADNRCHVLQNLRTSQGSAGGTRVKDGEKAG